MWDGDGYSARPGRRAREGADSAAAAAAHPRLPGHDGRSETIIGAPETKRVSCVARTTRAHPTAPVGPARSVQRAHRRPIASPSHPTTRGWHPLLPRDRRQVPTLAPNGVAQANGAAQAEGDRKKDKKKKEKKKGAFNPFGADDDDDLDPIKAAAKKDAHAQEPKVGTPAALYRAMPRARDLQRRSRASGASAGRC